MKGHRKKTVDLSRYGYIFIAPFFLVFIVFQLYPLIYTFYKSFYYSTFTRFGSIEHFGLENYKKYIGTEKEFWWAVAITVGLWLLNFVPQILLSLLLAAWFTDVKYKLKHDGKYKVIMYMPNIITAATIAVLFYKMFNNNGPMTEIMRKLGMVKAEHYVLEKGWATFFIIAFIQFWMWYGNTMIVLCAGIMGISPSLYEAAMVDGATSRQQFFKITVPLLKPILQFTLVTSAIGGLQMYDIPYLFNDGGPIINIGKEHVSSTQTVVMLIKKFIFADKPDHGRAAAYSVVLFFITLAVSMVFYIATSEKKEKKPKNNAKNAEVVEG